MPVYAATKIAIKMRINTYKKGNTMKIRSMYTIIIIMLSLTLSSITNGCVITFTNDSAHNIRIFDIKQNIFFDIKKNKSRRFGSAHERAHIKIYEKQPKNRFFDETFEIKQTRCANNGNPNLKYSDLENKNDITSLFEITKNKHPHKPMVRTLPIRTIHTTKK